MGVAVSEVCAGTVGGTVLVGGVGTGAVGSTVVSEDPLFTVVSEVGVDAVVVSEDPLLPCI